MAAGCLLTLALTCPAHAGWRIDRASAIANEIWDSPCDGRVSIAWAQPEPWAEGSGAWADPMTCRVTFPLDRPLGWAEFCSLAIHEFGHLAGASHSDNPNSVMSESVLFTEGYSHGRLVIVYGADRRCFDRGREYLAMRPMRYGWE